MFHEYMDSNFRMPTGLPFPREAVREYLLERIFGPAAARTLDEHAAATIVLYGSNLITRGALREHLASVVDIMAKEMTSRPGRDRILDVNDSTALVRHSSENASADFTFPMDIQSIHHNLEIRKVQRNSNVQETLIRDRSLQPLAFNTHPLPVGYPGHGLTQYPPPPRYTQFPPFYQHPTNIGYGVPQMPMQQVRAPQGFSTRPYGYPQLAQQFLGSQYQFQAPIAYSGGGQYPLQYPLVQSIHSLIPGPPQGTRPAASQRLAPSALRAGALGLDRFGIDSPAHKSTLARSEPAHLKQEPHSSAQSTVAQLSQPSAYSTGLAHSQPAQPARWSTDSKTAQVQLSTKHTAPIGPPLVPIANKPEWGIRYSSPTPTTPAVSALPYYPRSDITRPKLVGGSPIKYHDLTRHGKPSYAIAVNKAICPIVESAKESKPALWGVLKIGNVSQKIS